jgi:hypothetical protein
VSTQSFCFSIPVSCSFTNYELAQPHGTAFYTRTCDCASPLITVFHYPNSLFMIHAIPCDTAYGRRMDGARRGLYKISSSNSEHCVCEHCQFSSPQYPMDTLLSHRPNCGGTGQLDTSGMGFFCDLDSSPIPFHFLLNTKSAFMLGALSHLQCAIIRQSSYSPPTWSNRVHPSPTRCLFPDMLAHCFSLSSLSSPSLSCPRYIISYPRL